MYRYERLQVLGRGSFGQAFVVRERPRRSSEIRPEARRPLRVVKEVYLRDMPQPALKEAENEVEVLQSLSHVHIVAYHGKFIEDDSLFIVMEYADGGDLYSAIQRRKSQAAYFQQEEAISILGQCSNALSYIHARHILHRDLKSPNIFLTKEGTVKIGDFGIAKVLEHTRAMAMTLIGTPTNLPPEVCDSRPYGTKADIWSMGVVFYELLSLETPFQASNLAALVLKIVNGEPKPLSPERCSRQVRSLAFRMLRKDPDQRPSAERILGSSVLQLESRPLCWDGPVSSGSDVLASLPAEDADGEGPELHSPDSGAKETTRLPHSFELNEITVLSQALLRSPKPEGAIGSEVTRRAKSASQYRRCRSSSDASLTVTKQEKEAFERLPQLRPSGAHHSSTPASPRPERPKEEERSDLPDRPSQLAPIVHRGAVGLGHKLRRRRCLEEPASPEHSAHKVELPRLLGQKPDPLHLHWGLRKILGEDMIRRPKRLPEIASEVALPLPWKAPLKPRVEGG